MGAQIVLSIIAYSLSASAERSRKTLPHTPRSAQRLKWRLMFFQYPKRSGRSRQGMSAR